MIKRRSAFRGAADADDVASVLRGYWRGVVEAFEDRGLHSPSAVTRFEIHASWHDTCRHYAGAREDGKAIVVAPQIIDLDEDKIVAILAHEAGHIEDFAHPGRFWFRPPEAVRVRKGARVMALELPEMYPGKVLARFDRLPESSMGKHIRDWKKRGDDEKELVADAIASHVLKRKLGYTGPRGCIIQTLDRGIERPTGLR